MKNNKRILLHLLFWLVYFGVNLFNELYLSLSFTAHPTSELLFDSILTQLLVLSVKVPVVYYVLYLLIPRWINSPGKFKLFFESIFVLLFMVGVYRMLIQLIIWPYVYHEDPGPLTAFQLVARFFYSMLDLLQVIGIAAAIKLFRLRIDAIKNEKALMQEKLKSEMLHLKSQLNPHFLFNTLNSIYALSRTQSGNTADAVMRLSKILRYMLYESEKKTTSIGDELKIIDDYLELQQLRFGKRINLKLERNIENDSTQIAPLLILPLIENTFKHGNVNGAAEIEIKISLIKNMFTLKIINPVAMQSVKTENEEGIGLSNIKRQLELLYRKHKFSHSEKKNTFTIDLQIDLSSYSANELFDSRR
ncbi:MAG: histidine kinase [Bacteroidia bacterium]